MKFDYGLSYFIVIGKVIYFHHLAFNQYAGCSGIIYS